MKKLFILALVLLIHNAYAQNSNAVFFTENGERFTLIMNGQRINNEPQTNVKAEKLNGVPYVVKILFENTAFGEVNDKVYLEEGKETSYSVKERKVTDSEKGIKKFGADLGRQIKDGSHEELQSKKDSIDKTNGKYVIRLVSSNYIQQSAVTHQTSNARTGSEGNGESTTQQTQTTTTTSANANGGSNGRKANLSFNLNVNAGGMETNETTQTTHTSTTTTTNQQVYVMPGYEGPTGCSWPMNDSEFAELKGSIASKTFEDSKLTIAKQVTKSRCMTAAQVKEIAALFTFEDSKLNFAKYAYDFTFDIGNYFKVNDVFQFESSISDLDAYISSRR